MNDEDNMLYIFLSPFIAQQQVVFDAYQSRLLSQIPESIGFAYL
jgi:hypothetical protein